MPRFRQRIPEVEAIRLTLDNEDEVRLFINDRDRERRTLRAILGSRLQVGDWLVKRGVGDGVEVMTHELFAAQYVVESPLSPTRA